MSEQNDFDQPLLQLTPHEKTVYSHLFNLADTDGLGVLTGERAVSFFEKTHVPASALGEIWQIADNENRGLLTKPAFCMVVRLIGWYQNGQQTPSSELAFKPAPIPKFDGISIPQPQQTATSPTSGGFPQNALQPQLSGQSPGGAPIRVPPLDPAKVQQYSGLFERSGAQNGLLEGGAAKSIFERAGLPNEVLGKIWMLSDRQQRGALDETEFIVAMHLLTSMKTRSMNALPNTLPPGLYEAAARRGQRPPSRQMSGQPSGVPRQFTGGQTQPRTQSPLARQGFASPPPQSAQTTGGVPWLVTPQEKVSYDRFFSEIDKSGQGVIAGDQAVEFFSNSNLNEDTLAAIWDLADINSEGQLNKDEFAVAMYLIKQQRSQNAPPLPAFLPPALIPPSMRKDQPQQQQPSAAAQAFQQPSVAQAPKASDDLFGLDSSPTQTQFPNQPSLQPQGTGASATRDPFGGSGPSSPSSPARFTPQQSTGSTTFKQFVPTSAFGASLASQHTGQSTTSSQGQARGFQQMPQQQAKAPSTMDDLLGDNETHAEESSKLNSDTTELANMSNQIGNLRTQMEATQTRKTATQADLTATQNQKRDLEQRLQQFRAQYESEVKTVKEMEQQLAASRDSTKKLGQELAMIEGTHQDLQTQHNTVSQQLQADQQENAKLKQQISQMNSEITRMKPEIEKMKLDARQQKGLVSINKKQLATNEAERDRLQSEKADLESAAATQQAQQAEQARSAAASPEPAVASTSRDVVSPAASTMSSTNPFFRQKSGDINTVTTPPPASSSGPTPSAFDALFGPSEAFAPKGQAGSRTGTPPATSFIGRSMPTAAAAGVGAAAVGATAVGGAALADSMSSTGELTPSATGSTKENSPLDTPGSAANPPPPPESRQFTPTNLPLGGGVGGADRAESVASSTKVMPPASRAGGVETPREFSSSPAPVPGPGAFDPPPQNGSDREIVPGAFPDDEGQPPSAAEEIKTPTPKATDDFDSAFASFGEGEKTKETTSSEDPFAPSSGQQASSSRGFDEFPPIQNLDEEEDDSSDSDDEEPAKSGFDDSFTTPPRNEAIGAAGAAGAVAATGATAASLAPSASVASGNDIAAARPEFTSNDSTASGLPPINKEMSPPTYEQSDDLTHGGSGERSGSNQFPPEYGNLLPSREDPTSPPPPTASPPPQAAESSISKDAANAPSALSFAQPEQSNTTGLQPGSAFAEPLNTPGSEFFDASSRPMSSVTEAAPEIQQPTPAATEKAKSPFDEFDDFGDLSEAKEADNSDFGFGRQSQDEFNPAFDSPAPSQSQTPTPMNRSLQTTGGSGSNGFADFKPNVSTSNTSALGSGDTGSAGGSSIQQTPQAAQHDWDAIFSGLDSSKDLDTSFNGSSSDPWAPSSSTAAATTNGNTSNSAKEMPSFTASEPEYAPPPGPPPGKAAIGSLGRAITPGTEHDDPILKRLTGMGYPRGDALSALEKYDYDINKAVDHLSGS